MKRVVDKEHVMNVIRIDNLTKSFKSGWPGRPPVMALDGLSLEVTRGEIFGFLGPNGAGKTTTLKILIGLMQPDRGTIETFGRPIGEVAVRKRIGFLPESPYFYDYLTACEFLTFYGQLAGLDRSTLKGRVNHLLDLVGLVQVEHRQLRKFSKGMLQRVGLAQAIIHDPELVVLDEPMSGLDPLGRKHVRDLILRLREQGKTVFFSSHIIPDVEMMCDRVGVVMKGKLVAAGRVDELVGHAHTQSVEIVWDGVTPDRMEDLQKIATQVLQRGTHALVVVPGQEHVDNVVAMIRSRGGRLISVTPQKGSLEELFFEQVEKPSVFKTAVGT
jgi:ABC-2 type transport system ATP-binding protein